MKELKQFPTTDYNKFPQKYYFESVAKNIIRIASLKSTNKTVLNGETLNAPVTVKKADQLGLGSNLIIIEYR